MADNKDIQKEIKETASLTTVHWLVDIYKFAVIEPDNPVATAKPAEVITDATAPECDLYKYIRKPPKDKMTRSSFNKTKRY